MGFSFRIAYKSGASNKVADALSRRAADDDASALFMTCARPMPHIVEAIHVENTTMEDLLSLHALHAKGKLPAPYSISDGLLYYGHRLCLSSKSTLRATLLFEFHSSPLAGHTGVDRTFRRLSSVFYWSSMRRDVKDFVRACPTCQAVKYSTQRPGGLLQPLPIPNQVWDEASMDFVTGLPSSRGFTVIMVVVDRLSKYVHFGTLSADYDALKVAVLFIDIVVKLHGFPKRIVSDRDRVFLSDVWRELMRLSGTKLTYSTAYHPQTDGQTEVMNRSLEQYLRAFTHERPNKWSAFLPWAEISLNCSHHAGINTTPFRALYGCDPPSLLPDSPFVTKAPTIEEMLIERMDLLHDLKTHLAKMQQRMRLQANKHRRDVNFNVGDLVLLKLQPYRQYSLARPRSAKLSRRYYGPFPIVERIGPVAYRLQLPDGARIHPVFHVSLLRPYVNPGSMPAPQTFPEQFVKGRPLSRPVHAHCERVVLVDGTPQVQWLVQWSDGSRQDATWEPMLDICTRYPDLRLADKAVLEEGEDDTLLTPTTVTHVHEASTHDQEVKEGVDKTDVDKVAANTHDQEVMEVVDKTNIEEVVEEAPTRPLRRARKPPPKFKDYV